MTQQEITQVGQSLIAQAQNLTGDALQNFYDDLENESRQVGGDESMPLGWVAQKILEISRNAGCPIRDEMAPPPHGGER